MGNFLLRIFLVTRVLFVFRRYCDGCYIAMGIYIILVLIWTHKEIFLKSYQIKPKSDCIYHFPIDLETKGPLFGSKYIGLKGFVFLEGKITP